MRDWLMIRTKASKNRKVQPLLYIADINTRLLQTITGIIYPFKTTQKNERRRNRNYQKDGGHAVQLETYRVPSVKLFLKKTEKLLELHAPQEDNTWCLDDFSI